MSTKVITGEVRFGFVHVFEKASIGEGSKEKYSVQLIIDKGDTTTLAAIEAAVKEAAQQGATGKFNSGGKVPTELKLPLRDGEAKYPDNPVYKNKWFINASTDNKPQIVDADLNPIMSKEQFYSGCFGRASVNFYPFNSNGNRGVAAGLNNLQFLRDGEHLAGGSTASEDFGTGAISMNDF